MNPAAAGRPGDVPGPYSIGADPGQWPGLSRLIEEAGAVLQLAGQIIADGGTDTSWHPEARILLVMRLGSLRAAIDYVIRANDLDPVAVNQQRDRKQSLYGRWHHAGRQAAQQNPPAAET